MPAHGLYPLVMMRLKNMLLIAVAKLKRAVHRLVQYRFQEVPLQGRRWPSRIASSLKKPSHSSSKTDQGFAGAFSAGEMPRPRPKPKPKPKLTTSRIPSSISTRGNSSSWRRRSGGRRTGEGIFSTENLPVGSTKRPTLPLRQRRSLRRSLRHRRRRRRRPRQRLRGKRSLSRSSQIALRGAKLPSSERRTPQLSSFKLQRPR